MMMCPGFPILQKSTIGGIRFCFCYCGAIYEKFLNTFLKNNCQTSCVDGRSKMVCSEKEYDKKQARKLPSQKQNEY